MFGSSSVGSRHEDLLSATPTSDDLKRQLVSEIKNRAKGVLTSKNYPEAIELYTKAIEVVPSSDVSEKSILYANRSMCHSGMGKFSNGESDADLSINLNPLYTKAYFRKATALIGLRKYKEAKSCVITGLEQIPDDKDLNALLNKVDAEIKKIQPTMTNNSSSSTTTTTAVPTTTTTKVVPQKAASTNAAPKKKESSDDSEEDLNEEEVNVGSVRGYKKLADGRVTTFFNNTLDEQV